jgi:signal transduction histidine kinase
MNAPGPVMHPAIARVDDAGALIDGDARILDLNRRAGGDMGRPLAVPEVAALARLASRLGIAIARNVVVADGDDDLDLWVRAEPGPEGVRIEASGWRARAAWAPSASDFARDDDFVRSGADWLWEADAALNVTHLSPEVGPRLGIDASSLLGAPLTRLFAFGEDEEGGFPILGAIAAQARFDGQRAEVRGTSTVVHLSAVPRIDLEGRFAGFVGSARAVVSVDAEPKPETAFPEAFGKTLGSALRAPLGRIIANADSMSAQVDGPLAQDYTGYATDIASAGRHLLALVDDLNDLATVERPDFATLAEPIDLADVARRAAGLLSVRAAKGDVRIDKPGPDDSLPAIGEFRRALQVLVNLIGNAVRYSPAGSVIWVRAEQEGDRVCVIVADQGKGIAADDHARIFEKFGRVDPGEPGGSGLGLYISQKLARAMGGDIIVDSALGQGARFVFSLPAR